MNTNKIILLISILLISSYSYSNIKKEKKKLLKYLNSVENKNTGLYKSFLNTQKWVVDTRYPNIPPMKMSKGYLDNQTFLKDNAYAIIALLDLKKYKKAKKLLSIFELNFKILKNNKQGLFTSYLSDNFDYFYITSNNKKNLLIMGIDGNRRFLGPQLILAHAAQMYYYKTKSYRFIDFIFKIFKWAKKLPHIKINRYLKGGPSMGYGWGSPWQFFYSTETVLYYNSFLKNLIKMIKGSYKIKKIMRKNFINMQQILNEKKYCDNHIKHIGFNKRGTFNRGATQKPYKKYKIDKTESLNVNSLALLILSPHKINKLGIETINLLRNMKIKFKTKINYKRNSYNGFDFTTIDGYIKKRHRPLIWWEGTAKTALAYKTIYQYLYKKNKYNKKLINKYRFYMKQMNKYNKKTMKTKLNTLPYITYKKTKKSIIYCYNTWWPISVRNIYHKEAKNEIVSLTSTLWRYFAVTGLNPFRVYNVRIK